MGQRKRTGLDVWRSMLSLLAKRVARGMVSLDNMSPFGGHGYIVH